MAPPSPWSSTYRALVAPTLGVSNETNSLFALSPPKKTKKEKKKKREWLSRQTVCFALRAEVEGKGRTNASYDQPAPLARSSSTTAPALGRAR